MRKKLKKALSNVLTVAIVLALLPITAIPVKADTEGNVSVSTYTELSDAISDSSTDTIDVTADIVVDAQLDVSKDLTIYGNGHTISVPVPGFSDAGTYNNSPSAFRVFQITSGTVAIENATIKGGVASKGSGIFVQSGATLNLNNVTISNSGGENYPGGGICNNGGTVFLNSCNIIRNGGRYGGGFLNLSGGKMFVENCSFSENRSLSTGGGGGAGENQAYLYINNSTFSNNKSTELGGAINNYRGTGYILNSTFSGNVNVSNHYEGGAMRSSGDITLINDIFAYNYTSTDGSTYTLNDFDTSFWSGVTAYNCIFHGSTCTGTDITQYNGAPDGSDDALFTGGSTSQVLSADGSLYGNATIYQPYLAKVAGAITTSVPLKSGSDALEAGIPTAFSNGDGTPIIGYYTNDTWTELTDTDCSDLSQYQVTTDQNDSNRNTTAPALGAVESTVDSLSMVKVNKTLGGTVIGGSVFGDTYADGDPVTLTAIPDNRYQFKEWDDASGSQLSTDNPYSFIVSSDVTVTPVFEQLAPGSYIITYIGNGNTSGSVPETSGMVLTEDSTISQNTGSLEKTGYTFSGWNTRANGSGDSYAAETSYEGTSSGNLTLYAQWTTAAPITPPAVHLGSAVKNGDDYNFPNVSIEGSGIKTILISFSSSVTNGDAIILPTSDGSNYTIDDFTVSTTSANNDYTKRINIVDGATAEAVQEYLQNIDFSITDSFQTIKVIITSDTVERDTFYNIDTQHYYQYIPYTSSELSGSNNPTWMDAYDLAKDMTFMGRSGYLATITSLDEDEYVYSLSGDSVGWLGGTVLKPGEEDGTLYYDSFSSNDEDCVNNWYWACGPERGDVFYSARTYDEHNGSDDSESYYNWAPTEPNNGGDENCLSVLCGDEVPGGIKDTIFSWNDISYGSTGTTTSAAHGYFVEYGNLTVGSTEATPTTYATGSGIVSDTSYDLALDITVDGNAPTSMALKLDQATYDLTNSDGTFTTDNVPAATYNLYVNGKDTGTDILVDGSNISPLTLYTVRFDTTSEGTASNSSISVTVNGSSIENETAIVAGSTVILTAEGTGSITGTYTYLWSGDGTNNETTKTLTIDSLNGPINADCTVTGEYPATYTVSLDAKGGTINSGNVISYTFGDVITLPTDVVKENSTFAGWYENPNFSGNPVTEIAATDAGNKTYYAKWTYTVSGTITEHEGNGANGATVIIRGNNTVPKQTTADSNGVYSFSEITAGEYNIIATLGDQTQTTLIVVTDRNVTDANVTLPPGTKNSVIEIVNGTEGTPDIVIGNLEQQFTSTDNDYSVEPGNKLEIKLTVEEKSQENANGASNIQTLANGKLVNMYLDMKVTKTKTGAQTSVEQLSTVSSLLKIVIPYDLTGKTDVTVYRVHDGIAAAMTEQPYSTNAPAVECFMVNSSKNQITVWSKNFSTYAVGYSSSTESYTVSYDDNGATSGGLPSNATVNGGTPWNSPGNTGNLSKSGYVFKGWALTNDASATISSYTINKDTTFFAVWKKKTNSDDNYTITISPSDGGSISPSGTIDVTVGESKIFTFKADEGYSISEVLIDGESVGAVNSYTLKNISGNHTIKVKFAKTKENQNDQNNGETEKDNTNAKGLPYYINKKGNEVFIGFAAEIDSDMKYLAPDGAEVLFKENPKNFTDIAGRWSEPYINFVTERELFVGTGENLFSPENGMTRAMFATVIGRLYERSYGQIEALNTHTFTDCNYNDYYGNYVDWAAKEGIIDGYGNGEFGPEDQITREQMAAIIYRFAKFLDILPSSMDSNLNYPDANNIPAWANNAALYCQSTNIIAGRDGGNFVPQSTATRAEVSVILENFIKNKFE